MPPRRNAAKPVKGSKKAAAAAAAAAAVANENEIQPDDTPVDVLRKQGVICTYAASTKKIHRNVRDINVSNLTVTYHGAPLIEEAELTLNYGNRYGYLGRNGCGKSTFMRVIAGRCFPMAEGIDIYHVSHEIEATDLTAREAVMEVDSERAALEAEAEELNDIIAENEGSEEAELAMDRLTQVYERLEELDSATAEARASKILSGLGFTPAAQAKKTKDFSGGWRMRIALARALFIQPTLLLLDEPTNHLDMEAVVWLEDYLSRWEKILLLVSHSQDFLNGVCTHIIHQTRKKLVLYSGNYDQFVRTREEKEEEQEKRWKAEQDQIKHMKAYVAKFGQGNAKMAKQAQSKEKTLEKMLRSGLTDKVEHEKELDFRFPDPSPLSPPVLQCTDISFGYPNCEVLYKNVDFGVDLDSRVALVGPNGAGKSTLLKIMTGELLPLAGSVRPHAHLRISKFSQHFVDALDLSMSPLDYFVATWPDLTREDARKFLGRYGISGSVQTQVMGELSDGQKSRVVFAKMARESPHLLLLDEPTNHLDMESIDSLARAINQFQGGMMLVSHDMRLISQVAKEIWLCDNKTVSRYVGEISDFKMQLRRQVGAGGTVDGGAPTVGTKSGNTATANKTGGPAVVQLAAKKLLVTDDNIPDIAPPSANAAPVPVEEEVAPIRSKKAAAAAAAAAISSEEAEEKARKLEEKAAEKAAAKARRKAEKEAAAEAEAAMEEERRRRREEKARDMEEAARLAAKLAKEKAEWEAQKAEKDAKKAAEEAAIAAKYAEEQRAVLLVRLRTKRDRLLKKAMYEERERRQLESYVLADNWTQEEQEQFEIALMQFPLSSGGGFAQKRERWTAIAEKVGNGKTKQQCLARYRYLKAYFAGTA